MAYTVVPGGTFDGAFYLGSDIPGLGCLFHLELDKLDTGIPVFRSVILPIGREVDTVCRDAVLDPFGQENLGSQLMQAVDADAVDRFHSS